MDRNYFLITGTFQVVGASPDGDSVRFKADNKKNWGLLDGPPARLTKSEGVQLRFEGVDALETHYRAGTTVSQPKALANEATDSVLDMIGVKDAVWTPSHSRISSATDGTPGYILAKMTERYRRPIAFVFAGPPPRRRKDGDTMELEPSHMTRSLNYRLMEQGLVYPTYYKTLHWQLRDALTFVMKRARKKNKGIWKTDGTQCFSLTNPETITDDVPILPKLFRRLMRMYANQGSFKGMNEYLLTRRETVVQISHCHFTHFNEICVQTGNVISMSGPPEDFVFTS